MLRDVSYIRCASLLAVVFSVISALSAQPPTHNHAIVEWYADLSPAKNPAPGVAARVVQTQATGVVTASFDFERRTVTFHAEAKDLTGVRKIEVREARSPGDFNGPTIFTIYDSREGPFTGTLSKTVTSQSFEHIAGPVLNGHAAVVVTTDSHPDGEIAGVISMHKRYSH